MVSESIAAPAGGRAAVRERTREYQAIALVSAAHFVNHFQNLILPPLFPFLKDRLGIGFVELGFALTIANLASVAAQLPVGFLVDRLGCRRMLVAGLLVSAASFVMFGVTLSYPWLLVAMAFLGLSNSVFHPADYAILSAVVPSVRLGRAFSIHTFAGFLGNAVAPMTMLAVSATFGLGPAMIATGLFAVAAAIPLGLFTSVDAVADHGPSHASSGTAGGGLTAILTPAILGLTGFFTLLSLSTSGISTFSVAALTTAYDTPLSTANLALTGYLTATAFGVLAGGFVADMTRRHAEVAALGYGLNALIVLVIGALALGTVPLIAAMSLAGFLGGLIMPSRDMMVRAAAPPGAVGRTFGVVTSGFSIGGMIGPLVFGLVMDHGYPQWVFYGSVIIMVVVAATALIGDRRSAARRRLAMVTAAAD